MLADPPGLLPPPRRPAPRSAVMEPRESDIPSLGIYVFRGEGAEVLGAAVKGGSNGIPHCHHDLGSFVLSVNNVQVVSDIGAGVYNKGAWVCLCVGLFMCSCTSELRARRRKARMMCVGCNYGSTGAHMVLSALVLRVSCKLPKSAQTRAFTRERAATTRRAGIDVARIGLPSPHNFSPALSYTYRLVRPAEVPEHSVQLVRALDPLPRGNAAEGQHGRQGRACQERDRGERLHPRVGLEQRVPGKYLNLWPEPPAHALRETCLIFKEVFMSSP